MSKPSALNPICVAPWSLSADGVWSGARPAAAEVWCALEKHGRQTQTTMFPPPGFLVTAWAAFIRGFQRGRRGPLNSAGPQVSLCADGVGRSGDKTGSDDSSTQGGSPVISDLLIPIGGDGPKGSREGPGIPGGRFSFYQV
jgi:hypothetical protein